MTSPFAAVWSGDGWDVARRDLPRANAELVIGQRYVIEVAEERSWKAHRRYFALVREAWMNLPDGKARQYPSPDHLRKRALIRAGFRNERSIVCGSKAEALRISAFVAEGDQYAVVLTSGATVTVFTARSQRGRAMDRDTFRRSSEAVLTLLAEMIGVEMGELEGAAA